MTYQSHVKFLRRTKQKQSCPRYHRLIQYHYFDLRAKRNELPLYLNNVFQYLEKKKINKLAIILRLIGGHGTIL